VHNLNPTAGLANVTPLVLHSVEFKADEDSAHGNELIRSDPAGEVIEIPVPYAVIVTVPSIDPIQRAQDGHNKQWFLEVLSFLSLTKPIEKYHRFRRTN
jgi:hypothetical protein